MSSEEFVPDDQLLRLLLSRSPLIDVRSEIEHSRSAFEQSLNLPLLRTGERAEVGTVYRHEGSDAAIQLGHRIVSGRARDERIAKWVHAVRVEGAVALYCARGGLRSQIAVEWLREAGVIVPRIRGGFKALRQILTVWFESSLQNAELIVIAGKTGTGKSHLLRRERLSPSAIDLEAIARHYGSAFGAVLGPQPPQATFESSLFMRTVEVLGEGRGAAVLEDESRRIGHVMLPLELHQRMATAARVELVLPLEQRVQNIVRDYIDDVIARDRRKADASPEDRSIEKLGSFLQGAIARIGKRLGGERARRAAALVDQAIAEQRTSGSSHAHAEWIRLLLEEYYDPLYEWDLAQKQGTVVFSGTPADAEEVLLSRLGAVNRPASFAGSLSAGR